MWDYDDDSLLISLKMHFKKANLVNNIRTQAASNGSLSYNKVNNTVKYGIKSFKYQGVKLLNDLKMSIYNNSVKKSIFLKELKSDLLSTYVVA